MIAVSIMIEGQQGLTWQRWQRLASEVEQLGFAGLFRSDHFTDAQPPDRDSLETVVSLAYLACNTQRIHFGPLAARYADIGNGVMIGPKRFRELNGTVDEQVRAAGRQPGDVRRTVMTTLVFGQDAAALDARLARMRDMLPADVGQSTEAQLAVW